MLRAHEERKRTEMSREQRKGQNSAHVLLQKASSQLRGERVPLKTREEDELAQYLSSLTQKTSQQVKSVSYEEYGDISISSGADPMTPIAHRSASPVVGAGSKFLKKKSSPAMEAEATASRKQVVSDAHWNSQPATSGPSFFRKGQAEGASSGAGKKSILPAQMSTALNKAMTLANIITQHSTAPGSGRQLGFSKYDSGDDEHATFQHHGVTVDNARSRSESASDPSIGHDRGKFIKKPQIPQSASPEKSVSSASPENVSVVEKDRSKSLVKQHPTRRLHSSSQVYLMSEDESLAEFIQHLSGSDESGQKIVKQKNFKRLAQASKRSLPSKQITKQRTPSPASAKGDHPFHRASHSSFQRWSSQDSDIADSIASEVADNIHGKIMIADSISLDESVPIKVMDASSLDQSRYSLKKPSKSDHSKKGSKAKVSPFKRANSPATSSKRKLKKEGKHLDKNKRNIFQSFCVHSVEELIGGASEKENSDESEILTEPLNVRRQKDHSTSQIITEIHSSTTPQQQVSYSSQFEESISEKIDEKDRGSHLNHLRSVSEAGIQQGDETETDDYSEDFASETLSVAKTSEDEDSSHYKYSDEDLQRESVATDAQKTKLVIEKRSVEIQTAAPPGLHYQWNMTQTGVSILGPSHGLDHVDPTPIAATVVNPDALEAMTAYSPATLALIDMMKQQMDLIRQFMRVHDCLYHSLTDSNVPDYHYTTLQDTKEYIKRHRNRRLAVKEALQMVSEEVNW